MRILIIDQCSSSKEIPEWFDPFDVEMVDAETREELLQGQQVPSLPARDLYTGRQQQLIARAVDQLRANGDEVDRVFISAGFGVVEADDQVPPYNVTFTGRSEEEIIERTRRLDIESSLRNRLIRQPGYDAVFFALGKDYYLGIDLLELIDGLDDSTNVVLFNQESVAEEFVNVISIPARIDEARENGAIVIGLKGQFIKNFAEHRQRGATVSSLDDLREFCTTDITSQSGLEEFEG